MNKQLDRDEAFISFRCKSCGQEIEAQLEMAGSESECPACGNPIQIPIESEAGTLRATHDEKTAEALKGRTIRIELSDEF